MKIQTKEQKEKLLWRKEKRKRRANRINKIKESKK
jgi:hypothetical protein